MAKNSNMHKAKKEKNDEFYTQLTDIEKECFHYKDHFKDKIIFCNCDDPEWSNFWKYFEMNFDFFGLKKLVSTHYSDTEKTYKLELYRNDKNELVKVKTDLEQNGDFRSPECIDILNSCDIVVTNPPFSLAREYLEVLINSGKKFLFIGNQNAISNIDFFKHIKNNNLWLGINYPKEFKQPDNSIKKFGNICWFTNLEHNKRNEPLKLGKKYYGNENNYPKYDNYDAIEVNKVKDIPEDYMEYMGVPITFLQNYCPNQFEILMILCGNSRKNTDDKILKLVNYVKNKNDRGGGSLINNKITYSRILIKRK